MSEISEPRAERQTAADPTSGDGKPLVVVNKTATETAKSASSAEPAVAEVSANKASSSKPESAQAGETPGRGRAPFHWVDSIQNMKSIAVNMLMISATLLALPVTYKIVARNALTINEFSVPSASEEKGISGKVLAQRLHDELIAASRFVSRQVETQGSTPVALEEKLPQIDLPIQGVNLALLVPQLRSLFGFSETSISGELIVEQAADPEKGLPVKFGLRLRAPGEGAIYRSEAPSDNIDHLLREAALVILQREDPIVAAYYYMFRKDYGAARRMADIANVSANPKTRLLAVHVKGLIARGLNDWSEAASYFRAVIKSNPEFKTGYANLASATRRFDLEESEAVAQQMIARFPDFWMGFNNLALVRLVQRRGGEAVEIMAKAEALAPRDPDLHFQKQFILRAVGQYEQAIAALQLAQDLNPTAINYLEETARLQRDLGKLPEALAAARRITVVDPTNPLGFALVARLALDSSDFRRAEDALDRALSKDESFAPALAELGRMQTLRGALGEAEATFALAEQADPRLSETWEYRGDFHTLRQQRSEAISAMRKAVDFGTFPAWRAADPSAKLGKLLEASGDLPGALEAYERANRLDRRKYASLTAEIERLKARVEAKP